MSNKVELDFINRVQDYISEHQLLLKDKKYIVALSGGADSVALLLTLSRCGYHVEAATCNFHLRGEESDRDEMFCVDLCNQLHITIHRAHFDTRTYASLHKVSIEMAARELRYTYFDKLRKDVGCDGICVAHHRDDCVETVLINLLRGTGIHGLRGILPRNGNILRPLLCVTRKEIETFLGRLHQKYVTDSSNLVDDVMRNKIRLDLLPMLEQITPAARKNIYTTSQNVTEATTVFDAAMQQSVENVCLKGKNEISIENLLKQPSPESTLFSIIREYGFSSPQCLQIIYNLHASSGRIWSSNTHELLIDRGRILISQKYTSFFSPMRIPEEGIYNFNDKLKISFAIETISENFHIDRSKDCACLDADTICWPLNIRSVSQGDRFIPFGMRGSKLISDYLTDCKCSLFEKRNKMVVEDAKKQIVWLVGERIDNRCRIVPSTRTVLKIVLL